MKKNKLCKILNWINHIDFDLLLNRIIKIIVIIIMIKILDQLFEGGIFLILDNIQNKLSSRLKIILGTIFMLYLK